MTYSKQIKNLIINADDFGWDVDTCQATIECMEAGSVTSATIMTGRPASEMAYEYARNNSNRFSFGLHFNIVDGHSPLSSIGSSLIESKNFTFRQSNKQRIKALTWQLKASQIAQELEAQLMELKNNGILASHIDSHGHLHKFPSIFMAIKPILKKNNINYVRRPQNLYDNGFSLSTKIINKFSSLFITDSAVTDNFLAIGNYEKNWLERTLNMIPIGTTEMAVHPGNMEKWRLSEKNSLTTSEFNRLINDLNIKLISYNELK